MRPVTHYDNIPISTFTSLTQSFNKTDCCTLHNSFIENDDYYPFSDQEKLPILVKQCFLNDKVRNLNFPKDSAQL